MTGRDKEEFEDGEGDYNPFLGVDKGAVLQEARIFHEAQLDVKRCQQVRIR